MVTASIPRSNEGINDCPMHYIISLSGGVASAVAADRAIQKYGRENVSLWFADTSWEDEDLYRFITDCMKRWGGELTRYTDGRTPLEVASDKQIIPNSRIAPCTHILKIKPFRSFIIAHPKPLTVLLGLDWREQHRMEAPRLNYSQIEGVSVDYPLMWQPFEEYPYTQVVESWGITTPRLYTYGFSHNNCGGRCVKQGQAEWNRLRTTFPDRFDEVAQWEQEQRGKGGPRSTFAILSERRKGDRKPLTLLELAKRNTPVDQIPNQDDRFACFCSEA